MPKLTIIHAGLKKTLDVSTGLAVDEILLNEGFILERQCAGRGTCGRCRVKASGALSKPSDDEIKRLGDALRDGWRLSCRLYPTGDAEVVVGSEAVHSDKIVRECPPLDELPKKLGLAIDLGTTTVAAFLVDMESCAVIAGAASLNRQAVHGADVISRMQAALSEPNTFSRLAKESIAAAVAELKIPKAAVARIEKASIVGNTAMLHLLAELPVKTLIERPFEPHSKKSITMRNFGGLLDGKSLDVRLAPVIGGFVGGDALACAAWFGMDRADGPALAADLGTNGEVVATDGKRVVAASAAAGPAFEGANISQGMRASPGAVLKATWIESEKRVELETVGDAKPIGIAGSGLLSLIKIFRDINIVEQSGRIIDPSADSLGLVEQTSDGKRVRVAENLFVTQGDIRELQKAKGAIRACAEILIEELAIKATDLKKVYLTGSFGGRLDPVDAIELGLIPTVSREIIVSIPNGAGLGAAMFLNDDEFASAEILAGKIHHVELFDAPAFMDLYMDHMKLS